MTKIASRKFVHDEKPRSLLAVLAQPGAAADFDFEPAKLGSITQRAQKETGHRGKPHMR